LVHLTPKGDCRDDLKGSKRRIHGWENESHSAQSRAFGGGESSLPGEDIRVLHEAQALVASGYQVSVICPA